MPVKPRSFKTPEDFRSWLEKNHASEKELILRCFKQHARDKGIGYREALDEALCWGWIDGVRKALDEDSFTQRFTPRKAKSNWSVVNIKRAKELIDEGRMCAPGLAAFEARDRTQMSPYSSEAAKMRLDPALEKQFRANRKAWEFFQAQPPGYRRLMVFRIMTGKREETRAKRFADLLKACARQERMRLM